MTAGQKVKLDNLVKYLAQHNVQAVDVQWKRSATPVLAVASNDNSDTPTSLPEPGDEFSFGQLTLRVAKEASRMFYNAGFSSIHLTQCRHCRRWTVNASGDELQAAKLLAYELGNEPAMLAIKEIRKERKRCNWLRRHSG